MQTRRFNPYGLNPYWTIEYADAAMFLEAARIMQSKQSTTPWFEPASWGGPLSEIEREYQLYQNDREWPES